MPGRYRDAFASSEFRALFGAFVVSMLGYVVAGLALTVLVYRQTNSALLSALTFTMTFVPYLFGGALLSGLVDRVPPRRLLVVLRPGRRGLVAVMVLPGMPVPALFALLFALSLLTPLVRRHARRAAGRDPAARRGGAGALAAADGRPGRADRRVRGGRRAARGPVAARRAVVEVVTFARPRRAVAAGVPAAAPGARAAGPPGGRWPRDSLRGVGPGAAARAAAPGAAARLAGAVARRGCPRRWRRRRSRPRPAVVGDRLVAGRRAGRAPSSASWPGSG